MLRIACPGCGERDYTEFRYGGDASKLRPRHGSMDRGEWLDYVYVFDNPKGPHREFWQHVLGCRHWLVLERDTATNTAIASHRPEGAAASRAKNDDGPVSTAGEGTSLEATRA